MDGIDGMDGNALGQPLLVIGGGNMGRAIVLGAAEAGALAGERVVVVEPERAKHAPFAAAGAR